MEYSPQPKLEYDEMELDELDDGSDTEEDPNVFRIRGALPEYVESKLTIQQLHGLIHEGGIDLEPSYQRDVVWPESKQIFLIHSLFHNYYVPPIVFAVHPADDDPEEEVRVCVDGKQRLTSIQKFCDGQSILPDTLDPKSKKQWWFTIPQSAKGVKAELPDGHKRRFLDHILTCVEYRKLAPGAEHEVFQRVQMGMTLTGAEKLQALSSPWASWIRDLEHKHVSVDGGLASVLEWDTRRGRDFQNIAYLVCCCAALPDKEEVPTSASMMKWIEREDPPIESFKKEIEDVLVDFWNIGTNKNLSYGLKNIGSRLAPVEFIFVGVLLYVMRKKTMEDRASAITSLRKSIRAQYKDIRLNTSVCKSMWAIIRRVQHPAVAAQSSSNTIFKVSSLKGKKKRKERDDDEDYDDEDEYRPGPMTGLGGKNAHTRSKKKTILS
ncbi:hypothetical protein H0H92_004076 [Tricholoma furcatifolium]|nr:hypothetical protein H0H92_004076 [Tricholoma furcatifolium]